MILFAGKVQQPTQLYRNQITANRLTWHLQMPIKNLEYKDIVICTEICN